MKSISKLIFLLYIAVLFTPYNSFAEEQKITRSDAFVFFAKNVSQNIPDSFQYIQLNYRDVVKDSALEDALQKLVYLNLIENKSSYIYPRKNIDIATFGTLAEKFIQVEVTETGDEGENKNIATTVSDLQAIQDIINKRTQTATQIETNQVYDFSSSYVLGEKQAILYDVYNTLNVSHYDKENFVDNQLVEGAIKGLTDSVGDTYTTYFPAVESTDFFETLEGEFEGIGAYIEMESPGKLIIISPIVDSPAESSGVKGGDRVTHVDGKEITEKNSLNEVISWIKGPAGTKVELTIEREGEKNPILITVTRAKIIIKDVEHKKLDTSTYYIQIKSFGSKVDSEFTQAIEAIEKDSSVKKIIIDLRNNPGGYLDEVALMLSYFVPKGEATAIVSNSQGDLKYRSLGYDTIDMSKYSIVLLQNGGSASASEIMVGTIKDYYPNATIIGEKSFGKGSVQSLKNYYDGSTLKFTSAKWFTGKTRQGIDKIGITPDIELEFDSEKWDQFKIDNQLERAQNY